jgi:TonB family protein
MLKIFAFSFILTLFAQPLLSQNSEAPDVRETHTSVDTPAEYPGGMPALYKYFQTQLRYPHDARRKGIEGKTFVEFTVSSNGFIFSGSVRIVKGLYPSCDEEAMRVIRYSYTQWKPARKNGKAVNQKMVLPIAFTLTPADPLHPIELPIKTAVTRKVYKSQDSSSWKLFSDARMRKPLGRLSAGDSVEVTGWAPWAYFVEMGTKKGYVSWKSVQATEDLEKLSKIVAARSAAEDSILESASQEELWARSLKVARSTKAKAFFSITANKKSVYIGECVTVTTSFNVSQYNTVALQFYDVGAELIKILPQITPDKCWITNGGLSDIVGVHKVMGGEGYTIYPFYKASYCPAKAGVINIPAVKFHIGQVNPDSREIDSLIQYTSRPLSIKVNALPSGPAVSTYDDYKLVGKFTLADSLLARSLKVGDHVTYQVSIRGDGLTFPVHPPVIKMLNVRSQLQDIIDMDTLMGEQLQSSKTFVYQLIFGKPGVYDFGGMIGFTYFDESSKKQVTLKSNSKVTVSESDGSHSVETVKIFGVKTNFIAIDVSQSMQIEDYSPNRLGAVKTGLQEFLVNRKKCEIGLIIFGGNAKHYPLSTADSCYAKSLLDSIGFNFVTNGTAIGDAIWLAKNSFAETTLPKKLVIIGDGDNTAGRIPPKFAAEIARKYNVKIYTIGVGKTGLVPFGRDRVGRLNMIDNTFIDKDLKTISSITNGQYYWAKDEQDVSRILRMIFP